MQKAKSATNCACVIGAKASRNAQRWAFSVRDWRLSECASETKAGWIVRTSTRAGQPDEQLINFTMFYEGRNYYSTIRALEVRQDPALCALLDNLTALIKARSNRPVQLY